MVKVTAFKTFVPGFEVKGDLLDELGNLIQSNVVMGQSAALDDNFYDLFTADITTVLPVPEIPAGAIVPLGFVMLGGILYLRRRRISVKN